MEKEKRIEYLRKFFNISCAVFEAQHTIANSLGYLSGKSHMHFLHLEAQKELRKENPSLEKIDSYLLKMENIA